MSMFGRRLRDSPGVAAILKSEAVRLEHRTRGLAPSPIAFRDLDEQSLRFLRGEISVHDLLDEKRGYRLVERGSSSSQ